jgi:hypothetical protein
MPATKRTRIQRARDLEIVARRYLKGESQQAIANDLGVARSQIAYDVAKLIKMWQASAVNDIAQARAIELRRINNIEAEAWEQWELSKQPTERSVAKRKTGDGGATEEAGKTVQTRTANIAYMQTIQWCISERCKLLGIYAAVKGELSGTIDYRILLPDDFPAAATEPAAAIEPAATEPAADAHD